MQIIYIRICTFKKDNKGRKSGFDFAYGRKTKAKVPWVPKDVPKRFLLERDLDQQSCVNQTPIANVLGQIFRKVAKIKVKATLKFHNEKREAALILSFVRVLETEELVGMLLCYIASALA